MKHLSHGISSLMIAALISFFVPIGAIVTIFGLIFMLLHFLPAQWGMDTFYLEALTILKTFGGGSLSQGLVTIALTTAFVGMLLTAFNLFYSHYSQPLSSRANPSPQSLP